MKSLRDHIVTTQAIRPVMISVTECAKLLGCCDDTVYNLIHSGRIPAIKIGAAFRIDRNVVLSALEFRPKTSD